MINYLNYHHKKKDIVMCVPRTRNKSEREEIQIDIICAFAQTVSIINRN